MKKFGTVLFGMALFATSCIKVDIDNSSTGTDTPSGSYNTKQEEIIATGIITGVINDGENVVLPKRKYTLKGYVYVNGRANITFAPGSIIVSDTVQKGALIIERNSRLIACGTATEPIIFTSGKPAGRRTPGDWGGLVLLGNAPTNRTTPPIIEGGINAEYGGSVAGDNSGSLCYVRIEYAGIAADPNSEINGLTLGGVGSGTQINNVQVSYGNDDAYEFFGGTVNAKNLIAFATADDDYDFDFGYIGRIQFAVSLRDPNFVDAGDAGNGVECDNDGSGSNALPFTRPVLSNFTWVGPNNQPASNGTVLTNHNFNMRWRRATSFAVYNSILMAYNRGGFSIESDTTANGYKQDTRSAFRWNLVHAITAPFRTSATTLLTGAEMETKALADGNTKYASPDDIMLTDPFKLTAPNFLPKAGSPALSGANFPSSGDLSNSFFTKTAYRGAFGADNWMTNWTSFTPQTNVY
jgi:hypothetical protein